MAFVLQKILQGSTRLLIETDLVPKEPGLNINFDFKELIIALNDGVNFFHFPSEEKLSQIVKADKCGAQFIGVDGTAFSVLTGDVDLQTVLEDIDSTIAAIPIGTGPGGTDGQFQFKNGTIFGGSSSLFFDNISGKITVNNGGVTGGDLELKSFATGRLAFFDVSTDKIAFGDFSSFSPQATVHIHDSVGALTVPNADAATLMLEGNFPGMTISTTGNTADKGSILFMNSIDNDDDVGGIIYLHDTIDTMTFRVSTVSIISFTSTDATINGDVFVSGQAGIGTLSPDPDAILDLVSTTKAFIPPRMSTAQRDAIPTPTAGMVIYNTDNNVLDFFNGTIWGPV